MPVRPVLALAALVVVAACGGGSDKPDRPAASGPTPTTPSTTTPSDEPTLPTSTGKRVPLTGVVGEADENGCLTLTTTGSRRTTWVLVGATANLAAGDRVTVRGSPAPDLATRCQQGTPFVVEAVEPG